MSRSSKPKASAPRPERAGRPWRWPLTLLALCPLLGACQTRPPLSVEPHIDVPRFMGTWYVIACIPTVLERRAYGPQESYRLDEQGRVRTVFTFHQGSFEGPLKRYTPTGFIRPGSGGAVWGMQFLWPIKADYRIVYVDPAYSLTVIGRERRDYAWIMARTPRIAEAEYERLEALLQREGYDVTRLRRMPQPP